MAAVCKLLRASKLHVLCYALTGTEILFARIGISPRADASVRRLLVIQAGSFPSLVCDLEEPSIPFLPDW